jgi:hypothetical protein
VRSRIATLVAILTLVALTLVATSATAGEPPVLEFPLDCSGTTCLVQTYVDADPGPGEHDYRCGPLTDDGDSGTDIRVPDFPTLDRGIPVLAAAAGVVRAARDGMADVSVRTVGPAAIRGREAGNGVVIDHGDGWETQYGHLRRGSVRAQPGETVTTGQPLGLMGLSGNTEFPHLNFVVRYQGKVIDPFIGLAAFRRCGDARAPLWSPAALAALPYVETAPLIAGFATGRPEPDRARHGDYGEERLPADAPALVLWAETMGVQPGDVERFRIEGPDGRILHDEARPIDAGYLVWFAFSGRKRPPQGWAPGDYRGSVELSRAGSVLFTVQRSVRIDAR